MIKNSILKFKFSNLFYTRLSNENLIEIIICTSMDYLDDLIHLKPDLSAFVWYLWSNKIKIEYFKGFFQKYYLYFYTNENF